MDKARSTQAHIDGVKKFINLGSDLTWEAGWLGGCQRLPSRWARAAILTCSVGASNRFLDASFHPTVYAYSAALPCHSWRLCTNVYLSARKRKIWTEHVLPICTWQIFGFELELSVKLYYVQYIISALLWRIKLIPVLVLACYTVRGYSLQWILLNTS